jgi:hypothetical protein
MDFNEAEQKRIELSTLLRSGKLTPASFAQTVTNLRVTDTSGTIWQPNPSGDGWIFWTGSEWQMGTPPGISMPDMAAGTGKPQRSKESNESKSSMMTIGEFKKISKELPLANRPQRWWDLLSILGGIAAAAIWFLYGSIRSGNEGFDLITPLLMITIPVILVRFRGDIDKILLPLQPYRKKVPRPLLIGLGIAAPFLTAWILYNIFSISQYPLMQANIIIGITISYVIVRDPVIANEQIRVGNRPPARTVIGIIFLALFATQVIVPVMADDCIEDPFNAQDCLRTDGYAEVMAGLIATILSVLINGPIIVQTLLQGASGAVTGVQPPVPPAPPQGPFVGDKTTFVDARGETRTAVLQADGHWLTDQGTWYDPDYAALLAEGQRIDAANAAWRAQAAAESAQAQAAADAARKLAAIPAVDPVTGKRILTPQQQIRRDALTKQIEAYAGEAAAWSSYANKLDNALTGLEWTKYGCDKAIDVLGQVTGPVGKTIAKGYKIGTNLGEGLGEGMAEGGNYTSHIAKGAGRAAVDLIGDKITDKGFEALGKALEGGRAGKIVGWINQEIKVNPDPMAIRIGSRNTQIVTRAVGNAAKGWLKGWGPGYATDGIKDNFIGK